MQIIVILIGIAEIYFSFYLFPLNYKKLKIKYKNDNVRQKTMEADTDHSDGLHAMESGGIFISDQIAGIGDDP